MRAGKKLRLLRGGKIEIPSKAGIQCSAALVGGYWIPAFAGISTERVVG